MILGQFAGGPAVRTNYNQTDPSKADYLVGRESIAKHLANENNPHGVTFAQIGAAPAGYGLGTSGTWAQDLNNATESGFYAWTNTTPNSPFSYGNLLVLKRGSENARITQIGIDPYMSGTGAIAVRHNYADGWYDWEYLNPPMTLNVEYKTAERYGRKRVYTKAVDCGALPNKDRKNFNHGISDMKECLSAVGVATGSGGFGYNIPLYSSVSSAGQIGIYVNSNAIQITTTADWSGANAVVILKYTKTTD